MGLQTNDLSMTQELIAIMRGMRREGVTEMVGKLHAVGRIGHPRLLPHVAK